MTNSLGRKTTWGTREAPQRKKKGEKKEEKETGPKGGNGERVGERKAGGDHVLGQMRH